jgi:hypothetical protein
MYSLELIMKYYNLKLENTLDQNQDQISKRQRVQFPLNIWEKVFNMIDDKSLKVSIFSHFLIQIASPRNDIHNLVKIRCEKQIVNEKLKVNTNNNDGSLIKFKLTSKDVSIDKLMKSFWLKDEELIKIHSFIKDKLLTEMNKNQIPDHNFPTIPSNPGRNDNNNFNSDDEYLDLIKIPELINICDDIEESKLN